jgi:hypothetical protein
LPTLRGGDDRRRYRRFEDAANGGLADHRSIDQIVAQRLHLAVDALAGAGRIRGGAAKQQKRECDKNRGHADLVTSLVRRPDRLKRSPPFIGDKEGWLRLELTLIRLS